MLEIAKLGKISATAFMANTSDLDNEASKKIFFAVYINKMRIVGCLDSGSDVNVMHESRFRQLSIDRKITLDISTIQHIVSFSDTKIKVIGEFSTLIRLSKDHPGIKTVIYVIEDIDNVPPFLVGNDTLKAGMGRLAYVGPVDSPQPELIFTYPEYFKCTVYYVEPSTIYQCVGTCGVEPGEIQEIEFYLHPAAVVVRNDYVLTSGTLWWDLNVLPTRSDLEYVPYLDCYVATGYVTNTGTEYLRSKIYARFELCNNCEVR